MLLAPLQWDNFNVVFMDPESVDPEPLRSWLERHFGHDVSGTREELRGVAHFMSEIVWVGDDLTVEADLGSAPVAAFTDLLQTLRQLGGERFMIGSELPIGAP